jgi:hypothetical protein
VYTLLRLVRTGLGLASGRFGLLLYRTQAFVRRLLQLAPGISQTVVADDGPDELESDTETLLTERARDLCNITDT